jgi:hypothetical protein
VIVDELITITVGRGRLTLGSWRRRLDPDELDDVAVGDVWPNHLDVSTANVSRPRFAAVLIPPAGAGVDQVLEYTLNVRRTRDATRFVDALKTAGYR